MRRICALVFVLTLVCPVVAFAGGAAGDPYGASGDLTAFVPAALDWLGSVIRGFVAWLVA